MHPRHHVTTIVFSTRWTCPLFAKCGCPDLGGARKRAARRWGDRARQPFGIIILQPHALNGCAGWRSSDSSALLGLGHWAAGLLVRHLREDRDLPNSRGALRHAISHWLSRPSQGRQASSRFRLPTPIQVPNLPPGREAVPDGAAPARPPVPGPWCPAGPGRARSPGCRGLRPR